MNYKKHPKRLPNCFLSAAALFTPYAVKLLCHMISIISLSPQAQTRHWTLSRSVQSICRHVSEKYDHIYFYHGRADGRRCLFPGNRKSRESNASIALPADPFYDSLHDHPSTLLRCAWYYVVIPCLGYLFRDHGCTYAGSGNEKTEPADTGAETRIASCSMPLD